MGVAEIPYPSLSGGLSAGSLGGGGAITLLDDDTQLRIVSANSVVGVALGIQGLRLDVNGSPQLIMEAHTPNTDRSVATQLYKLGKGVLQQLTVFATAGAPLSGQTYVIAQLVRGVSGPLRIAATLFAGYVTVTQAIGFPGSPIVSSTSGEPVVRLITGTTPGAGFEIIETVPTGARWELVSTRMSLATAAGAGTRVPHLELGFVGSPYAYIPSIAGVGPAASMGFTFGQGLQASAPSGLANISQALPVRALLPAGQQFFTNTLNILGGDQWGPPQYCVREWLEVA